MHTKMYHHSRIPTLLGGAGGGSLLPPELQACEYLQTNGTQDIIIPQILFQNTDINITAMFDNIQGFAGWNDRNNNWFGVRNNVFAIGNITIPFNAYVFLEIKYITNTYPTCTYSGSTYTGTGYFYNNGTFNGLHLFKISGFNGMSGKFKKYEVSSYNVTYTFQPCYVKSGKTFIDNKGNACPAGTPGMYDIINNIFYTNDGSGNFTAGPDIKRGVFGLQAAKRYITSISK